ncbi:MAG: alpha-E domain-containing protein, partial [Gemmataceae bacterium]
VNTFSLLRPDDQAVALSRGGGDLPSRMADNLFWLGRYAGRAEGLTRLLRVALVRLTEASGGGESPELPALLRAVTTLSDCHPGFVGKGAESRLLAPDRELLAVIRDPRRPGSLTSVLSRLGGVVGTVRDRISTDMWRVLSDLGKERLPAALFAGREEDDEEEHEDEPPPTPLPGLTLIDELNHLDRIVLVLAAFGGLTAESVTREEGWRFLDIGRKMERALHTLALVQSTLVGVTSPEGHLLEALLEITDSSMTYRRRYQGNMQPAPVLDLMLADETNPRSLGFQMAALAAEVGHLPRNTPQPGFTAEQRLTLAALTALRLADVNELALIDASGRRARLAELLTRLSAGLTALSESLTRTYLSHLQTSRHLGTFEPVLPEP